MCHSNEAERDLVGEAAEKALACVECAGAPAPPRAPVTADSASSPRAASATSGLRGSVSARVSDAATSAAASAAASSVPPPLVLSGVRASEARRADREVSAARTAKTCGSGRGSCPLRRGKRSQGQTLSSFNFLLQS